MMDGINGGVKEGRKQASKGGGDEEMINQSMNRPFSKMAAENSNKAKLQTYTSTRKKTFTLVNLQNFSVSGVILAEKM